MKLHLFGIATAAMIGCAPLAQAADPLFELPAGDKIVGSLAFTTQYYFRGLRQTDEGVPAVQGSLEYDHSSGLYAGVFGSNVSEDVLGPDSGIEVDFFGGYRGTFADPKFTYDLGLIYYYYPGYDGALDADWIDGKVAVGYDFGVAQTALAVFVTPEYQYESGFGTYVSADVTIPVGKKFSVFLHGGRQWIDDEVRYGFPDYWDYSIGVGVSAVGLDWKLAFIGTDLDENDTPAGSGAHREALVFTVSKAF